MKSEFDSIAHEYDKLHRKSISLSGESPQFFSEYKVIDCFNEVKKNLNKSLDELSILDFGAGVGNSIPFFKKYFESSFYVTADVSSQSIEVAKNNFAFHSNSVLYSGTTIPFQNESFDVVFCSCVFHHISVSIHSIYLKEILRILKHDGFFIMFEHNPYNPFTINAVNNCEFDRDAVLLNPNKTLDIFLENGFVNPKISYRIFFPNFLAKLRVFEKYLKWLPIGAQYYIIGKK